MVQDQEQVMADGDFQLQPKKWKDSVWYSSVITTS